MSQSGPQTSALAESEARSRDYAVLCLLTVINVMNFVDRQLLASFANFIVPDLGLSNTQFGLLTGFAFIVFYSVMGLFMGTLADRLHRPRLLAFGLALWSGLTAASGAAKGFVTMLIPRMLVGVGESVATPTAMSMLADRFPSRQLGFAAGFYYMGVPIGVAASLLIAGYLGPAIGWRACFYLLGGIGLLLAVGLLFLGETPRKGIDTAQPEKLKFREIIKILRSSLTQSPALMCTIAGGVAFHFILGAAAFDQLWFVNERGFERAEIARHSGWLAAAGAFSAICWAAGWATNGSKISKPDARCFYSGRRYCCCLLPWPIAWCRPTIFCSIWAFFWALFSWGFFTGRLFRPCRNWYRRASAPQLSRFTY